MSQAVSLSYRSKSILPVYITLFLCVFILSVTPSLSLAGYGLSEKWELTAFGTFGYTDTDKYDDIVIKREIAQRSHKILEDGWRLDSRAGVQLQGDLDERWTAVFQIQALEKSQNDFDNSVTISFLRYRSDDNWGFFLGRIPFDLFLLSDHRNVGYSYHWVRPPGEFYGWIPFASFDGFKTYYEFGDFDNYWRVEGFIGRTTADINIGFSGEEFIEADRTTAIASPAIGANVTWESGDFLVRLSAARIPFTENTRPNLQLFDIVATPPIPTLWPESQIIAQDIALKGSFTIYSTIGVSWKPGKWLLQSEISNGIHSDLSSYDGQRAYFTLGRRFGDFLPHITYTRAWDDRSFKYERSPIPAFDPIYDELVDTGSSLTMDQYTLSLGVRWDVDSHKALKAQCDRSTINDNSLGLYSVASVIDLRDWNKDTRTWCSVTFDWVY